jgi:hypothetical protein
MGCAHARDLYFAGARCCFTQMLHGRFRTDIAQNIDYQLDKNAVQYPAFIVHHSSFITHRSSLQKLGAAPGNSLKH